MRLLTRLGAKVPALLVFWVGLGMGTARAGEDAEPAAPAPAAGTSESEEGEGGAGQPADETASQTDPPASSSPGAAAAPDDGGFFDTAPAVADPAAVRQAERLKRGRLQRRIHPILAFAALGTMIGAEVVGTANSIQRRKGDGEVEPAALWVHRGLVMGATTLYYGTGIMVWTAPRGLKSAGAGGPAVAGVKGHADSSKIHAALSIGHGIGMATQLITGFLMANVTSGKDYEGLMVAHTISGFTTVGLLATAAIIITFS